MSDILLPRSGLVQRSLIRSKQQDRDRTRSRFRDDSDSLFYLWCSLTSCCDLSGESPDDGRFLVRPSSLTPSAVRQRAASEAGVTMYLRRRGEAYVTLSRRSQSGGQGKRAGRSIKGTMQPRNRITPSDIAGRDGHCEWRLLHR